MIYSTIPRYTLDVVGACVKSHYYSRSRGWLGGFLLACLLLIPPASATTYYVDANGGNDGNGGTSSTYPWQSLDKVNSRSFSAGDRILFRAGETFRGDLVPKSSGTSSNPIVFGSYGSGDRPRIRGNRLITGFSAYSSANVWRGYCYSSPKVVYYNDRRGSKKTSVSSLSSPGHWYYSGGYIYLYATSNPSGGVETSYSTLEYAAKIDNRSNIVVEGLEFGRADYISVDVQASSNITLRDCAIHASLPTAPTLRVGANVNGFTLENSVLGRSADSEWSSRRLIEAGGNAAATGGNWTLRNNTLYWTIETDSSAVMCTDNAIGVYNVAVGNVLIEGNQIRFSEDAGIFLSGNNTSGTITVRNNYVYKSGNSGINTWNQKGSKGGSILITGNRVEECAYRHNDAMGIHINSTWNPTIVEHNEVWGCRNLDPNEEDGGGIGIDADSANTETRYNLIHDNYGKGIFIYAIAGDSVNHKIHHNLIYHNDCGIAVSGSGSYKAYNVRVYNNSTYNNDNGSSKGPNYHTEVLFGPNAYNLTIKNNIFCALINGRGAYRFPYGLGAVVSDYNLFYRGGESKALYDSDWGYRTLAQWSSYGYDAHSVVGSPQYLNAAADDFHLSSGSPARDTGVLVGISVDMDGVPIPSGSAPDKGACEYGGPGGSNPTPTPTPTTPVQPTPTPTSPPPPSGSWAVVWTAGGQTGAQPGLNSLTDRNFRNRIRGTSISAGVDRVRLRLRSTSSSSSTRVEAVAVGRASTGSDWSDYDGSGVRATFGGSTSVTIPAGETVLSDAIDFPLSPGQDYVVAIFIAGRETVSQWAESGSVNSCYKNTTSNETLVSNVIGYNTLSSIYVLDAILGDSGSGSQPTATSTPTSVPTSVPSSVPTPTPSGGGSGTWQTLWTAGGQTGAQPSLNSLTDRNFRNVIEGGEIGGSAGNIRLRLRSNSSSSSTDVDAMAIAPAVPSGGDPYDYETDGVRVTVGGQASFTIPAGQTVLSDPVALDFGPGRNYVVSLYLAGRESVTQWTESGRVNSYGRTSAVDETMVGNAAGYASLSSIYLVEAIEGGGAVSPPPPAGDWLSVWEASEQTGTQPGSNVLTDRNYRNWIQGQHVRYAVGAVRLKLRGPGSDTHVDAVSIGAKKSSGDSYDTLSAPVRVTFNGSPSVTVPADGVVTSDPIAFDLVPGTDYLVNLYLEGAETVTQWSQSGATNSFTRTFAVDETGEANVSGYYELVSIYMLEAIEGQAVASPPPPEGWSVMWQAAEQTGDESPGKNSLSNRNYRNLLRGPDIHGAAQTVRLRLRAGSSKSDTRVDAASIAPQAGSGDSYDFGAAAVVVTFGGESGVTIPAGGSVVSDPVSFSLQSGSNTLVAFYLEGLEIVAQWSGSGEHSYTRTFAMDGTRDVNVSGYGASSNVYLLEAIEGR